MKLDIDCVRDVLLCLEEKLTMDENTYRMNRLTAVALSKDPTLSEYDTTQIVYTCMKLYEAGYISLVPTDMDNYNYVIIDDISFYGFQFLEKIRDPQIYTDTKSKLHKIGSFAFSIVEAVAVEAIKIKMALG